MNFGHSIAEVHTKSYDLSIGEPRILQEELRSLHIYTNTEVLNYPNPFGNPKLLKILKELHPHKHIVVTNGAKQALSASLYAMAMVRGKTRLCIKAPYWPTFIPLSKLAFMEFGPSNNLESLSFLRAQVKDLFLGVSPNNPDGSESTKIHYDIWDAAYASGLYGWSGNEPKYELAVYSIAKLLGLSGLRVGWIVTHNEQLAIEAANYMENTTTGVSYNSQNHAAYALDLYRTHQLNMSLSKARRGLLSNGGIFNANIAKFLDDSQGLPSTGRGMFAWFKIAKSDIERFDKALLKANVSIVPGKACGSTEDGWYRMSMGQTNDITDMALTELKKCMDNG